MSEPDDGVIKVLPRFEEPGSFDGAVIFCPVCCTHQDAEPDVTGWIAFECGQCESRFAVEIDATKVAEHAAIG